MHFGAIATVRSPIPSVIGGDLPNTSVTSHTRKLFRPRRGRSGNRQFAICSGRQKPRRRAAGTTNSHLLSVNYTSPIGAVTRSGWGRPVEFDILSANGTVID